MSTTASELDLDVDVRRQVETHQRVDGLGGRVDDVDEALVRAHLEVLAAVLVLVRRPDDDEDVLLRRQRHGAHHGRAGARHCVNDLPGRVVDDLVVVRLQPDADLLSRHLMNVSLSLLTTGSLGYPTPEVGRVAPASRRKVRTEVPLLICWIARPNRVTCASLGPPRGVRASPRQEALKGRRHRHGSATRVKQPEQCARGRTALSNRTEPCAHAWARGASPPRSRSARLVRPGSPAAALPPANWA